MLPVHPLQFFWIEDRRLLLETLDTEELDHFRYGHDLAIAAGRPAEQSEEVQHRAGQQTVVLVITDCRRPMPLAQLLPIKPVNHRQVREGGQRRSESAV